jgi:ribosomal protein S9
MRAISSWVINAEKVALTGKKETQKVYMTYSGWKGGEKRRTVAQIRAKQPEDLIMHAVRGMIPKNRLGRVLLTKLKVYKGPDHPHACAEAGRAQGGSLNPPLFSTCSYSWLTTTPKYLGTGRRKTAVARVAFCSPVRGKFVVNGRPIENYFLTDTLRMWATRPLVVTETAARFDVHVNVGGRRSQRPGRRGPAWHRARPAQDGRQPAPALKADGLLTARPAHARAQEVRPARGPQALPVLETLSAARIFQPRRGHTPAGFLFSP